MKFKETKFEKSECISLVAVDLFWPYQEKSKSKNCKSETATLTLLFGDTDQSRTKLFEKLL